MTYLPTRRHLAVLLLGTIVLLAALAPWLAPHDPRAAFPENQFAAPSRAHLFGTDILGRDVFSRVLYGARRTLGLVLLAACVTFPPGLIAGLLAGYGGRRLDVVLMTLTDSLLAIPSLLLALALLALLGSGQSQIALAVGVTGIPPFARITRAAVIEARSLEFVEAARAIGARPEGILRRHILPSITPALLAFAGVSLSWAVLNGAALTFLGYGGDISAPDWGVMLNEGRQTFRIAPWITLAPGLALSLTVYTIHLTAHSLNVIPRGR